MEFHPRNNHFSYEEGTMVKFKKERTLMVTESITKNLPAPYSKCRNIDAAENEKLSFYPSHLKYSRRQCLLSCYQANHIYNRILDRNGKQGSNLCYHGIPCPSNLSTAFGIDFDQTRNQTNKQKLSEELIIDKCFDFCPEPCTKPHRYDARI